MLWFGRAGSQDRGAMVTDGVAGAASQRCQPRHNLVHYVHHEARVNADVADLIEA
jgi:hypothetical protein